MLRRWKWSTPIFKLIKVSGDSMSPSLLDGDFVLIKKPRRLRPGLIYAIDHSDLGLIIKRLDAIDGDKLLSSGDNRASTPSAVIAPVNKDRVRGRAWMRISGRELSRI